MLDGVHGLLQELFDVVVMVADEGSLLPTIECLQPELAVIDASFPVANANVLDLVQIRFPSLKVIALSSHDEPVAVDRILASGASAFVLKRAAATDLCTAIDEVFAGRTYVSPAARPGVPHRW